MIIIVKNFLLLMTMTFVTFSLHLYGVWEGVFAVASIITIFMVIYYDLKLEKGEKNETKTKKVMD